MHTNTAITAPLIPTADASPKPYEVVRFNALKPIWMPEEDSAEQFFKEHEWGFGTSRRGGLITYRVQHPRWNVYRDATATLESFDFAEVYGDRWRCLNQQEPCNVVLAEGSPVTVSVKL